MSKTITMSVYDAMEQQKEIVELREKLALTENDRDEWKDKYKRMNESYIMSEKASDARIEELEKENKELKYKINKFLRLYKKGHSDSLFDYVETLSYEKY